MAKLKKRKDGRVEKSFYWNGKRYYAYGKDENEAIINAYKKEQDLKENGDKNRYKKGKELTIDEYHERWEAARYGTVRESTIRKQHFEYLAASNTAIDKAGTRFGDLLLVDIEVQNIRDLQKGLRTQIPPKYKQPRNSNGINGIMNLIKHILADAVNERIIDYNPAKPVKPLQRTEPEARDTFHRALTQEETERFFAGAVDSWYYDAFRFMIYSGCRCGEVGALTLADVSGSEICIRRTLTKSEHGPLKIGDSTKTKKGVRRIPMTPELREILDHQISINNMVFGDKVIRFNGLIFVSPRGGLLNDASLNKNLWAICQKAGITRFSAHAFRDTFATRAIEYGMKPKTLQEILGHSNISMTMDLYAHVMEETKIAEMRAIRISI